MARSPLQDEIIIALTTYLSVMNGSGDSDFTLTVLAITLPPATEAGDFCVSQLIVDLSRPAPYELLSNTVQEPRMHHTAGDTAQ